MKLREERAKGDISLGDLALKYGISKTSASQIVNGQRYGHLPLSANTMKEVEHSIPDEELPGLWKKWADGESSAYLAQEYDVPKGTLWPYLEHEKKPALPEYERVNPRKGAEYRDALIEIAKSKKNSNARTIARRALGMDD